LGNPGATQQPQTSNPTAPSSPATPGGNATLAQLPSGFPTEIPQYPNAQLLEVQPTSNPAEENNQPQRTVWQTSDPSNLVQSFYLKEFQANNWEILQPSAQAQEEIAARRDNLQVTVSIAPTSGMSNDSNASPAPDRPNAGTSTAAGNTEFIIQYERNFPETTQTPTAPTQPSTTPAPEQQTATTDNQDFTDLNKVSPEFQKYITDLAALDVFALEQTGNKSSQSNILNQFAPGKTITRREFAQWLVAANNRIYANRPSLQIRPASETTQSVFKDVPPTDPDFAVIQGLAEAGLILSRLSGDATAVLFRPDAPLTREQMILWKVPLDIRQGLPNASVDAVRESWGFQDVARIDPKALRAVLADFQNGEQSNIRRVFGYTTLFQPKKTVTRAEAAAALWYFGDASEGISAQEALQLQNQPQPQPSATPQSSATP
jgi:hypothetical protein